MMTHPFSKVDFRMNRHLVIDAALFVLLSISLTIPCYRCVQKKVGNSSEIARVSMETVKISTEKVSPNNPEKLSTEVSFDKQQIREEIRAFLKSRTQPNGLVASFANTSPYTSSGDGGTYHFYKRSHGKVGYLDDQAFTYDLALAAIGLILEGRVQEADRILSPLEEEFYLDKNGSSGLFNSYLVTSNIPLQDLTLGIDGDRIHAGPTLWIAIAALNHIKITRSTRYLEFLLDILIWCRTKLNYYHFADGQRGGISMGVGWGPDWSQIFCTEHNVDYFSVLQMTHDLYREASPEVRDIFREKGIDDVWLQDEMGHVGRWLREVTFDPKDYVFRAGYALGHIDPMRVIDGTSWGIAGVGPENLQALGIDPEKLMESTEKLIMASYTLPNGKVIRGFDLTDPEGYAPHRAPLVWFEATGQQIIAYRELGRYFERKGNPEKAEKYKAKATEFLKYMNDFKEAYHLKGCLPYMSINPDVYQVVKTMKDDWELPRAKYADVWVGCISSTMWMLYGVDDYYNPMKWRMN